MRRIRVHGRVVIIVIVTTLIVIPGICLAILWFSLPGIDKLHELVQTPSTRIVDRNGLLLYEIIDPKGGHHTPLTMDQIPLAMRKAAIAVEDANFYSNPGVDVIGIIRALWINIKGGEVLAGGSTITQQLARMLVLSENERSQRTLIRKLRESLLAWQIAQRYSKDEVILLYLNETYYGNLAYGVESAAQTYFGKDAEHLDLAECALLAGLLQSPVTYDPFIDPEAAKRRQIIVIDLMIKQGLISREEGQVAEQARISYGPIPFAIRAPHFVTYVRHWIEERYGTELLIRGGLIVTTTLDLTLNDTAQEVIRTQLDQLKSPLDNSPNHNTNDAALIAIDPHDGAIVAMVGSPDFFNARINGAVNAAIVLRQPGSAIKPITYAAAFSSIDGFTSATPMIDVRKSFPTREGLPYVPENYDRIHHGPISVRFALATSNNVAAVSVLQMVGLDQMMNLANELGIHSFRSTDVYGLSLTLGGGEVRLIELTGAYATFANAGKSVDPYAIERIADLSSQLIYSHEPTLNTKQVIDPRVAWLITDILADNAARSDAFGLNSVLRLDRPSAVKTGTTTDWRDNWTIGYTPDLVTGVWTGNADNQPMIRISGVAGAGPIWHDFMLEASRGTQPHQFVQPAGLQHIEICSLSGLLPSKDCPYTRLEWFIDGTQPTRVDDWYRRVRIDVTNGSIAAPSVPDSQTVSRLAIHLPAEAVDWATEQGWLVANGLSTKQAMTGNYDAKTCVGERQGCAAGVILQPDAGSIYKLSSSLPRSKQRIPLQAELFDDAVVKAEIVLDKELIVAEFSTRSYSGFWRLEPGGHTFSLRFHYQDGSVVVASAIAIQVTE